jgi:hypothetical protein
MSFRGYVSAKRRIHLQLPSDVEQAVRAIGEDHGTAGLGPAIRLVLRRGLGAAAEGSACHDCAAAMAALVAAEHAVLMVAAVLPEGQRRVRELAPQAAVAAEVRLSHLQESGRE